MDFKFSVVMAVYNKEKYVAEAIDSVINQTLNFKKNIQLILVNDKSTDNTLDILERYKSEYPQNITLITNEKNMGSAYSRNRGLEHVRGKYVNFLDSDDIMSKDAFKTVFKFMEKYWEVNIVSIPIYYFGVKRGPHNLNYKYEKDQLVNVITDPKYIQLSGASAFFRFEKLKKYRFNEKLRVSEDSLLINQMLLENPLLGFLSKPRYYYRKDGSQNSLISSSASTKSYFTSRVDEYFLNLINYTKDKLGRVPEFTQYVLMYDLQWIFEIESIDNLLSKEEIRILYDKLQEILSYIDEEVILNQLSIPARLKAHIILIKRYGWQYLMDEIDVLDNFKLNTVFLDNFQFLNDHEIKIEGIFTDFTKDNKIHAVVDGQDMLTDVINYPQRDNYSLNYKYGFNHNFKVIIPFKNNSVISFKSDTIDLNLDYNSTSRLSKTGKYKLSKHHLAIDEENQIRIVDKSVSKILKLELKTLFGMIRQRQDGWRTGVFLRIFYILSHPFMAGKHIWIFMDLPNAAGDNGLELFRYVSNINTQSKNYFVLNKSREEEITFLTSSMGHKFKKMFGLIKSDEEFKQIKKIGNVLSYRSLKHRLYVLYAEFIITSHPDNQIIYPFWGNYKFVAGFAHSKTVFLQHGVIKDDISGWANEYDKPLTMFLTSASREAESFKAYDDYGYDEDVIKVLGLPRFDRLEDNSKKQLVLMPSWRYQYNHVSPAEFVKTDFYHKINDLLSDIEVIDGLVKEGYTLIFKPHRNLHKFIDTFTKNPYVKFDLDLTNYTKTFNESSLLVTDYSSVFFDFAYLKKPVVYYQADDSYHFSLDKSYFDYEKDGFGPVCRTPDELRQTIFKLIENNLEMDDVYKKRVDEFFKFKDRNNSKRVYEEIQKLDKYY
ncbi:MAG: CDP-glycerol glycerophosphotransferase family protein [Methanobrevibacter sp.]|nr:CDP-glycerol glycerophosphotransferase family protein [Methanobrevibacter sp.]